MEWTWRWDSEWISTHTSGGYVYGYNEEDYGTDVKFLSTSAMSDAENGVSVQDSSSISSYMSITPSDNGLCADLTALNAFGCPIILTCSLYDYDDYADTPYEVEIRLDYDSVLGSLGTLEDWVEVTSEEELEDALSTSCNIRLTSDIECSVEISHRTHLDLNGHTLSGEADVSKRARIENGKITSSGDGITAEGEEKIEITSVDIEAGDTGVSANADVEISNCSVAGTSAYGIYASGGSVTATLCEIKSEASDTGTHAAVYSASSASITVNGGSVKGGVGAWAYTGNVTLEDVSVTSTAGDGLKAYQGTMKATGATIVSADSGAYCTNTGTVTLTSCDVTGTTYATYQSGGTLTVSGGTLSGPNGCYCSGGTTNLQDSCSVTATGSEGATVREAGGTINLDSCSLTGYYGIRCSSGSITATSSCTFGTCTYGAYSDGGTVNLNGAKMTSSVSSGAWANGGTIDIYGSTSISVSSYALQVSAGTMTLEDSSTAESTGSYGAYIDGTGTLYVQDSATSLSGTQHGVYISAGSLSMSGGKIEVESSSSAVYGVYLTGSSSSAEIKGGSVSSKNTDSSGSYVSYGAYVASSSNITVSGGEITGEGNEGNGYGIYITGSSSKATLSGGTITGKNNSSTKVSVGVRIPSGTVTIEGSAEIVATSPLSNAYGLYITGGTANIYDGTITGEMTDETSYYAAGVRITSGTLNVYGGNIIGTGGESAGIGIRIEGGTATVEDCSISATGSSSTYGVSNTGASLKLSSCSVSSSASSSSYGVYSSGSSASTTISGGSISGGNGVYASAGEIKLESSCSVSVSTSSSYQCAAVWEAGGTITLTSCTLTGYYGIRCSSGSITATSSCAFDSCCYGAYAEGGTITLDSSCSVSVSTSSSYKYAAAWSAGGKIEAKSCTLTGYYGMYSTGGSITASFSCTVKSCTYGAYATSGTMTLSSCTVQSCTYGAYASGGTINLSGCNMKTSITYGAYAYGGTIDIYSTTSLISSSYALYIANGGSIILEDSSTVTSTGSYGAYLNGAGNLDVYDSSTSLTGSSYGVYLNSSSASMTMSAGTVSGTRALYITNGTAAIEGGTLTSTSSYTINQTGGTLSCTATFSTARGDQIYMQGGTATYENCSVSGGSYRALYVSSGDVTLSGGSYSSSSDDYAVYNNGGSVTVKGASVFNSSSGGAFYNNGGSFTLSKGTFYSSSAVPVYIYGGSGQIGNSTKENCEIYRNAGTAGAACYIGGSSAVKVYGCYIHNAYGAALDVEGSAQAYLGYSYSGGSAARDEAYAPKLETTQGLSYAIYVNLSSGGDFRVYEADIYGTWYGIYIDDGDVYVQYAWITTTAGTSSGYGIYVSSKTKSNFSLSVIYGYFYDCQYMVYNERAANASNISIAANQFNYTNGVATEGKNYNC